MKPLFALRAAWAGIAILGLAASWGAVQAQIVSPAGTGNRDDVSSIFMPAPRPLRQALGRAQAAIAEQRYADAVEELGAILNGETADDFFLGGAGQGDAQTSLKTQAMQMLGAMPEKGRRLYEINYGADARAMLDAALAEGNLARLTEVARRYFHTKAGYEAAILLGRLHLDQGRPLAAALAFKRVADVPAAASQYDPELSLLLATSWHFASQGDKASETLVALKKRTPDAKIATGSKPVVLFERDEDAITWLKELVGTGGKARHAQAVQWVMFRGNETRTASTNASLPLLSPRWGVPTVDDPQDAQKVRQLAKVRLDKSESLIPSLQPLVVHDYVIYRTADRVIGASLENQGKRVWVFPWDETPYEKAARASSTQSRTPVASTREQQLNLRLWDDHAFGEMSSDGEQVFLIDEIGFPAINQVMTQRFMGARGGLFNNPFQQQTFNKLVALDLNREGALNWKVGGESGEDDPNLAGAFFLGPPLPMAGQLFVLAEFNGEVRLLCLSAKTGAMERKQSLAMMPEGRAITLDSLRRLAGATPSFAEGVLVCPTSGEGVAAVDLATRTLRWGYQYPRWDALNLRNNGFGIQVRTNDASSPGHWLDGSVTISGGVVLLTPIESTDLHCLDLLTGKAKWKPQPRGDMLFVACVHDGKAILVGKNQVKAIKLADGEPAWSAPIELENETPAGRGYYSESSYYLPVSNSQLVKIDLDKGTISAQVKTGSTLGNLVCYKDELLSQSGDTLSSYYLAEPLRKRVEEALAKNASDPWALARKGEILLQDGKQEEALTTLRAAHRLSPADVDTRVMLARVMLALLRSDFVVHKELAVEAEPLLADQPALKREFHRLRAQSLEASGSPLEAFLAYVALREQPGEGAGEMEELARDHSVRRDRWVSARLASLYAKADQGARGKIDEQIQAGLARAKEAAGPAPLADFVELYGFHPLAAEGRIDLSERLVDGGKLLEAELAAGELATSSDPRIAGPATAVLAALYEKAQRYDLAQARYADLAEKFSAVVCRRGMTGKDLADEAAGRPDIQKQIASRNLPAGAVEAKASDPQGLANSFGAYRYYVPINEFQGAAPRGQRGLLLPQETAFRAYDASGKLLSTVSLVRQGQQSFASFTGNAGTGKLNGHLMFVAGGAEILALDTLRIRAGISTEGLLWRSETSEPDLLAMRRTMSYSTRQITNPLLPGGARYVTSDVRGAATMGPVTAQGMTYLRGRQLLCVEPISGKILWERTGIEAGSDLFGDEQKIVVIAPGEKSDQALVLSAIDGTMLDRRMVDRLDRRWVTCGRNVLAWEPGTGEAVKLRLYDATNQGAGLWSTQVNKPAKGFIVDGEELALLEPSGKFTIVSLKTGKELLSATVAPEPELQSIVVLASAGQYILIANQPQTDVATNVSVSPLAAAGGSGVLVHGRVYAFDRASGAPQWQVPAFISQHALPQDQPAESPVLVFVRQKRISRGGTATSNVCSLLCLDKRDGSIVYEEDSFLGTATHCDIVSDRETRSISIGVFGNEGRTLSVKFTDNPAPPRPPAQTGMMSSLSSGQPRGTVVDVAGDVFRALNRMPAGANGNPPAPGGVPIAPFGRLRIPGLPVPPPR